MRQTPNSPAYERGGVFANLRSHLGAFCVACACPLDASDLERRSPSFKVFKEQVDAWRFA